MPAMLTSAVLRRRVLQVRLYYEYTTPTTRERLSFESRLFVVKERGQHQHPIILRVTSVGARVMAADLAVNEEDEKERCTRVQSGHLFGLTSI